MQTITAPVGLLRAGLVRGGVAAGILHSLGLDTLS